MGGRGGGVSCLRSSWSNSQGGNVEKAILAAKARRELINERAKENLARREEALKRKLQQVSVAEAEEEEKIERERERKRGEGKEGEKEEEKEEEKEGSCENVNEEETKYNENIAAIRNLVTQNVDAIGELKKRQDQLLFAQDVAERVEQKSHQQQQRPDKINRSPAVAFDVNRKRWGIGERATGELNLTGGVPPKRQQKIKIRKNQIDNDETDR